MNVDDFVEGLKKRGIRPSAVLGIEEGKLVPPALVHSDYEELKKKLLAFDPVYREALMRRTLERI